ncbi:hypothetical protein P5673_012681 [Acropora cervicornis]|uniref:Uncharacterized protein n=1 Tax=Acropora cervicornis TaxID=6130 RepID=A0AAD9QLW4_ACRCE|nr:hypothetical protein P5673_012681 [Acropora cervicornis]
MLLFSELPIAIDRRFMVKFIENESSKGFKSTSILIDVMSNGSFLLEATPPKRMFVGNSVQQNDATPINSGCYASTQGPEVSPHSSPLKHHFLQAKINSNDHRLCHCSFLFI